MPLGRLRPIAPYTLSCVVFLSILLAPFSAARAEELRVLVREGQPAVHVSVYGNCDLRDVDTNRLITQKRHVFNAKVEFQNGGIAFAGRSTNTNHLRLVPAAGSRLYLGFRRYHGELDFIINESGRLDIINLINLEDYLKGVLYHEASHRWPLEVLKAQAIASRSYALYKKKESSGRLYDLKADTSGQMYGGATSEKARTSQAVELTRGEVLIFEGEILSAYYHACCGGHTEDAGELWQVDLTPLKGRECRYCRKTKHWRWKSKISLDNLAVALNQGPHKIYTIEEIEIVERNSSGRVSEIDLSSPWTTIRYAGKEFRSLVGSNKIRSANFTVKLARKYAIFSGYGWGHGVGMCQWGAYRMSRQGWTAERILQYYYPGAEIVKSEK